MPKSITITYRFNPKYHLGLWEPFRWQHEDGSDAFDNVHSHWGCF